MAGKVWKNSVKAQVQTKLDRPLRDVIVDLINQTGILSEANRKLSNQTGIPINYDTFYGWINDLKITVTVRAK